MSDPRYYFPDDHPDAGQFLSDAHMFRKLEDDQERWLAHYRDHTAGEAEGCDYCYNCGASSRLADEAAERAADEDLGRALDRQDRADMEA